MHSFLMLHYRLLFFVKCSSIVVEVSVNWTSIAKVLKKTAPFLNNNIWQKVFEHIRENARSKGIFIDFINGYTDHVHCLISLDVDQTIVKTMQLIKGEFPFSG